MRNNIFRHNLTSHILAALLSLLLWSYVTTADLASSGDVSQAFSDVSLELRNVASNLQVTSTLPDTVAVTVRGASGALEQVTHDSLLAYVDLSTAHEGTGQYVIKVAVPTGLTATITPSRLEISLEQRISVDLSLEAAGDRVMQNGQLLAVSLSPQFVQISGVTSQVRLVERAVVQTNWQQVQTGVALSLPVQLLDASGHVISGLEVSPVVVEATVHRYSGKRVQVSVATAGSLASGLQLVSAEADPQTVLVYGPENVLADLSSVATSTLDLAEIKASGEHQLTLTLPEGVLLAAPSTVQVQVRVK